MDFNTWLMQRAAWYVCIFEDMKSGKQTHTYVFAISPVDFLRLGTEETFHLEVRGWVYDNMFMASKCMKQRYISECMDTATEYISYLADFRKQFDSIQQ